jgi:hypothetical protein
MDANKSSVYELKIFYSLMKVRSCHGIYFMKIIASRRRKDLILGGKTRVERAGGHRLSGVRMRGHGVR